MNTDRENIIHRARALAKLGVPFVHQGTTLAGIDCVGALAHIMEYDGELPAYPRDPVNGELDRYLTEVLGDPIMSFNKLAPLTDYRLLQPCDILAMQYRGPTRHVAIVIPYINQREFPGGLAIVHTDSSIGRVVECILDNKMLRRITKVWRPA